MLFQVRILLMAIRGLRQNIVRSSLATLGVVIGVGAVVAAMTILGGTSKRLLRGVETLGADQVLVFNGSDRQSSRHIQSNSLVPEDVSRIERDSPDLIIATAPQYLGAGQIKYFQKNVYISVVGTTPAYTTINDFAVVEGRFLTDDDIRASNIICVLGHGVADQLFGALPAVGKRVKINGRSFTVVGVLEEKGAMGMVETDTQVIVPLTTAMDRMFGQRYLSMIVAQCVEAKKLAACIAGVTQSLRTAHRIRPGDDNDFRVYTQDQFKQMFGYFALILGVVLYSIAGISLVVGAIGIMNIMLVSVTERTREIGVRIAVGARRIDILTQFLIEASIISFCGGALGVVFGWAVANFLSKFTQTFEIHIRPAYIVLALTMATVVGIISGIYPAIRAARLDPVQALRYE